MSGTLASKQAELEAAIGSDPGAPGFPALAELHRRAGRVHEAEQVARRGLSRAPDTWEGRVALALTLLDQGLEEDARSQLERLLAERLAARGFTLEADAAAQRKGASAGAGVSDAEIEVAFRQAETDAEHLITPNRVAEEALARVDAGAAEGLHESVLEPGSAFATATMAELLARQGDAQGAERIRASLGERVAAAREGAPAAERERRIATLERWLARIRGGLS